MKIRRLTEAELWKLLINNGFKPRDAKLQCRMMFILDSTLIIDGEKIKLLRREPPAVLER